jgi:hypothetical protein
MLQLKLNCLIDYQVLKERISLKITIQQRSRLFRTEPSSPRHSTYIWWTDNSAVLVAMLFLFYLPFIRISIDYALIGVMPNHNQDRSRLIITSWWKRKRSNVRAFLLHGLNISRINFGLWPKYNTTEDWIQI